MNAGPLVRLPSGKLCGGELNANGNLTPHEWGCQCNRCEPTNAFRKDGPRPAGSWSILNQNGNVWIEGPRIGGNGVFPNEAIVSLNDGCCTEADAKLIAAAPDLADATRDLLKAFRDCIGSAAFWEFEQGNPAVRAAQRALAKAGL